MKKKLLKYLVLTTIIFYSTIVSVNQMKPNLEHYFQNDSLSHCERPIDGNKNCSNSFCDKSFSGCGELKCDYQLGWPPPGGGPSIYLCNNLGFGTCSSDNHNAGHCTCYCYGNYCMGTITNCYCRVSLCYYQNRINPSQTKLWGTYDTKYYLLTYVYFNNQQLPK